MKRTIIISALLSLLCVGLAVEAEAEVRVWTGPNGEYDSTTIIPGGPPWRQGIWSPRGRVGLRGSSTVLNPFGDRLGDLMPAVEEQVQSPHHPWAVWSRFSGTDYDLVYSSWNYGWSSISRVSGHISGDDLAPDLAFTPAGQPMVAWWNRSVEDGSGAVYFTMHAGTGWLEPIKLSDDSTGGRHPTIEIHAGTIVVNYESDDGVLMSRSLELLDPSTITDDIDPQGTFSEEVEEEGTNSPKELMSKY